MASGGVGGSNASTVLGGGGLKSVGGAPLQTDLQGTVSD